MDRVQYLKDKAAECRAVAVVTKHAEFRKELLMTAARFERLASLVEAVNSSRSGLNPWHASVSRRRD